MAMKGEIVFFAVPEGDNVDKYVKKYMVTDLGGKVSRQLKSTVTCVVFFSRRFKGALEKGRGVRHPPR